MTKESRPTIIAGTRNIEDYALLLDMIKNFFPFAISEVVSGGASGVDQMGERYAKENKIPVRRFLPDWDTLGKKAGPIRNSKMAKYAKENNGCLLLIWNGKSRGSADMLAKAKSAGLPCVELVHSENPVNLVHYTGEAAKKRRKEEKRRFGNLA